MSPNHQISAQKASGQAGRFGPLVRSEPDLRPWGFRELDAERADATADQLDVALADAHSWVRDAAVNNPNATVAQLERALLDPEWEVRRSARSRLAEFDCVEVDPDERTVTFYGEDGHRRSDYTFHPEGTIQMISHWANGKRHDLDDRTPAFRTFDRHGELESFAHCQDGRRLDVPRGVHAFPKHGQPEPEIAPPDGYEWQPVCRDVGADIYPTDEAAARAYAMYVGSPVRPALGADYKYRNGQSRPPDVFVAVHTPTPPTTQV